jgi:hypothetical protein
MHQGIRYRRAIAALDRKRRGELLRGVFAILARHPLNAPTLRAFFSLLHEGDIGVFVTLDGFTDRRRLPIKQVPFLAPTD